MSPQSNSAIRSVRDLQSVVALRSRSSTPWLAAVTLPILPAHQWMGRKDFGGGLDLGAGKHVAFRPFQFDYYRYHGHVDVGKQSLDNFTLSLGVRNLLGPLRSVFAHPFLSPSQRSVAPS
jgi:hypothetical protein